MIKYSVPVASIAGWICPIRRGVFFASSDNYVQVQFDPPLWTLKLDLGTHTNLQNTPHVPCHPDNFVHLETKDHVFCIRFSVFSSGILPDRMHTIGALVKGGEKQLNVPNPEPTQELVIECTGLNADT